MRSMPNTDTVADDKKQTNLGKSEMKYIYLEGVTYNPQGGTTMEEAASEALTIAKRLKGKITLRFNQYKIEVLPAIDTEESIVNKWDQAQMAEARAKSIKRLKKKRRKKKRCKCCRN